MTSKTDDDTVVYNLRGFMVSDRIVLKHSDSDKWYIVSETEVVEAPNNSPAIADGESISLLMYVRQD